jgi:hypothetical protein
MASGPGPPDTEPDVDVRRVQPYQARKSYACPGCNQVIGAGVGHLVVVPVADPGLRRQAPRLLGQPAPAPAGPALIGSPILSQKASSSTSTEPASTEATSNRISAPAVDP